MNNRSIWAIVILLAVIIFLGWFFSDILIYMFVALVLSLLGTPLVNLLCRIHIKKHKFPRSLAAAITLVIIIALIFAVFYFVIPVILKEFRTLLSVDLGAFTTGVEDWFNKMDPILQKLGFLGQHEHFADIVTTEGQSLLAKVNLSHLVKNSLSATGSLLIALFSILFMTFFSLKDHTIFFKMIKSWLPDQYRQNFDNILHATGKQVSSYFIGVSIEMLIVGTLDTLFCLILGIDNALLIGCIGGLLNIIPYVGPLIACILSVVISITAIIPLAPDAHLMTMTVIKVIIAFLVTKGIDDFVLQPYIYGKSTKTHPLEIFIVILMAGYLGGVFAMIFAVPAYTLIRIVVKEFFGAYYQNDDGLTLLE